MSMELCVLANHGLEWPEPYSETTRDLWMHILNHIQVSKTLGALGIARKISRLLVELLKRSLPSKPRV